VRVWLWVPADKCLTSQVSALVLWLPVFVWQAQAAEPLGKTAHIKHGQQRRHPQLLTALHNKSSGV
jgi:hypothetical protein